MIAAFQTDLMAIKPDSACQKRIAQVPPDTGRYLEISETGFNLFQGFFSVNPN